MIESEDTNVDALRTVSSKERLDRPNVGDDFLSRYLGVAHYLEIEAPAARQRRSGNRPDH